MITKDPHSLQLIAAASLMGIAWNDLSEDWQMDVLDFSSRGRTARVIDGRIYPGLSYQQELLCDQKFATKSLFKHLGIPTPAAMIFSDIVSEKEQIKHMLAAFDPLVCKPLKGTDGHAVGMHFRSYEDILAHVKLFDETYDEWILEEQVGGDDLRIQIIGGKIAAACVRRPASVFGNGKDSIESLIQLRNEEIKGQNPYNFLETDETTLELIASQNFSLASIPPKDLEVQLKHVSNMSQGGRAVDCSDHLHRGYQSWIDQIASATGLRTFAFDALCTDPSGPPFRHAYALEINAKAQWLHHTFSDGKTHDIPKMILTDLFA